MSDRQLATFPSAEEGEGWCTGGIECFSCTPSSQRHLVPPVQYISRIVGLVVFRLSWLSGKELAAQARGVLGSTPGVQQSHHTC